MIHQYQPKFNREVLAKEVSDYILSDGYFMEFHKTKEFEEQLADYLNVKYCSCVPNGTIALSLALVARGVKAGDHVLLPNITMMSTQASIELIGAIPFFIDVDPENLCMNLKDAIQPIMKRSISAVLYVTLNGRSHTMEELKWFKKICNSYQTPIIEDNAQSFGSCHDNNEKISSLDNNIGCFSLSVAKTITTGQGGFMVTNNEELGGRIKRIKDLGRENGGHDLHDEFGINAKFTEIQSIIGLNQLADIETIVTKKKQIYDLYYNELKDVSQIQMFERKTYENIWFVDIYTENREELKEFLKTNSVGSRSIYPTLTSQEVNSDHDYKGMMPVSTHFSNRGLWLPSSLDLTEDQIKETCDKIKNFYHHKQLLNKMRNE